MAVLLIFGIAGSLTGVWAAMLAAFGIKWLNHG
jgi:hypothetical protein